MQNEGQVGSCKSNPPEHCEPASKEAQEEP